MVTVAMRPKMDAFARQKRVRVSSSLSSAARDARSAQTTVHVEAARAINCATRLLRRAPCL